MNHIVIPARLDSTRLPRKLLLDDTGKPLIQHTYERARLIPGIDQIIVATDSSEIITAVERFGGRAEHTAIHRCGTDRIDEVVRRLGLTGLIINLQGDEPEINVDHVASLINVANASSDITPSLNVFTLAVPTTTYGDVRDPSAVKVVVNRFGRALYFSRAVVPHPNRKVVDDGSYWLRHLGVYLYRSELFTSGAWPLQRTMLESFEDLEQLRFLEHGIDIHVVRVASANRGIDTEADYNTFCARWYRQGHTDD